MNLQGIMHVPLSEDAYMLTEKDVVISVKTAKGDMKHVALFYGDRVCMTEPIEVTELSMEMVGSDGLYDHYEARFESPYTRLCYYFVLEDNAGGRVYYTEREISPVMRSHKTEFFQFPYLRREDVIRMPEWTRDMVMYHIFPDSFADGHRAISGEKREIFEDGVLYKSENGGTLRGVIENLDYIASLGVNCIYLNPIFKANSYHKYDTADYFKIDPCFGTEEDLKELTKKAHSMGMRVILDGVFNHCGPDFFAFKDVLSHGEDSEYKHWFYRLKFPIERKPYPNYEAFAYVSSMPKLDTGNPEVEKYFCDVGRYWIRECDIDGWRMDVANEINHEFFRNFKKAIRAEKPDSFLIGEIWEDSRVWLLGDQFDSTMNYTFRNICLDFFAKRELSVTQFDERICRLNHRYPWQVALAQMNFLDTHDTGRFISFCEGDIRRQKLAVAYMMCAVGIPSVFYGDERGIEGLSEPEYRSPMSWDEEGELLEYYRTWMKRRAGSKALCRGDYRTLLCDDERGIYVFSRTYEDETVTLVMNSSERVETVECAGGVKCEPMSLQTF